MIDLETRTFVLNNIKNVENELLKEKPSPGQNTIIVPKPEILSVGSYSIEVSQSFQCDVDYLGGIVCDTDPQATEATFKKNPGTIVQSISGLHNNTDYYIKGAGLPILGNFTYGECVKVHTIASPIPDEYQLVEYLESSGTQFIDTAYTPTGITKWELDYMFLDSVQSQNGMSNTQGSGRFLICNIGGLYVALGEGINTGIVITNTRHLFELNASDSSYSIDGVSNSIQNSFTGGIVPIYIFARNAGKTILNWSVGKCYHCKLSESNTIKRDLYPVYRKADNKPGMYDIVNNVFYTNAGTGEFEVGPDKEWEE